MDPEVTQSRNSYEYAENNPVLVSDPEGMLAVGGGWGGRGDGGTPATCWQCKAPPWPFCGVWCVAVSNGGWKGACYTAMDTRPGRTHCFKCTGDTERVPCDDPISIGGGGIFAAMTTSSPEPGLMSEIAVALQGPAKRDYAPSAPRVQCNSGSSISSAPSE